jgi:plastocyanin
LRKLLVLVLVLVAGLAGALAATALGATSVKVGDNYFVRTKGVPTVTVGKGTTVRWNFRGRHFHNVTVKSGPVHFRSSTKSSGHFSKKLTHRGIYVIYCTVHGAKDQSMRLVVK